MKTVTEMAKEADIYVAHLNKPMTDEEVRLAFLEAFAALVRADYEESQINKATEALRLCVEALPNLLFAATERDKKNRIRMFDNCVHQAKEALSVGREALNDHIPDATKMIGCAYCDNPLFAGTKCNNCGRVTLAETVNEICQPDSNCVEADGCPTELVVLQRFWREQKAEPVSVDAVNTSENCVDKTGNNRHEPVKQEPVGVVESSEEWGVAGVLIAGLPIGTKLYSAPVDAKAIRAEALEEAAKVCDAIANAEWDAYKGRTEPIDRSKLYNAHTEGISDGADECATAIRGLK